MTALTIEQIPDEDATVIEGTRYANSLLRVLGQHGIANGPFEITERANGEIVMRLVTRREWRLIDTAIAEHACLVATQDGAVGEAFLRGKHGWWWAGNDPSDSWGGQIYPTHWMELPEAPP